MAPRPIAEPTSRIVHQRGEQRHYDVLVVGSGIAALTYVLDLCQIRPRARIALVTKRDLGESNSRYAQGGIASVGLPTDSLEQHVRDTLAAGDGLCNQTAVRRIVRGAPARIQDLLARGVSFDRREGREDVYDLTREAGHAERRIYHWGDQTGASIIHSLKEQVAARPNVAIFENHTAVNLLTQSEAPARGTRKEVLGAYVLDEKERRVHAFSAKATVLATGGAGKVYRITTNPDVATGDGIAMAYRAGARVGNAEFVQFHPTVLFHPQLSNFLLTEALRGEGGYLRHPKTGRRFMEDFHPDVMELATRDKVSRAIFSVLERDSLDFVHLDVTHKPRDFLERHFPKIFSTLMGLGIDMSKDPMPVVPAAHYFCGGVRAAVNGRTDLFRLLVLGEAAFTGLHGANRLASNSLIEGAVMAHEAAGITPALLKRPFLRRPQIEDWQSDTVADTRRASQIDANWRGLRGEMTSYAGIVRTEDGLDDLLEMIRLRRDIIEDYYWTHEITTDLLELRNITLVAELIAAGAMNRRESRGCHFREDYPDKLRRARARFLQLTPNQESL